MGSKNKVMRKEMQVVIIPVETVLNLIEMATARGMQTGARMILEEQEAERARDVAVKPSSPFLGDLGPTEAPNG